MDFGQDFDGVGADMDEFIHAGLLVRLDLIGGKPARTMTASGREARMAAARGGTRAG